MSKAILARLAVGAAVGIAALTGTVGVASAAQAAPASSGALPVPLPGIGLPPLPSPVCAIVYQMTGPLALAGLPTTEIVNTIADRLGGFVSLNEIRSCLGV